MFYNSVLIFTRLDDEYNEENEQDDEEKEKDDEQKKVNDEKEEEMEGKSLDEEDMQDSLVVEEGRMVNFPLVPLPLVCIPCVSCYKVLSVNMKVKQSHRRYAQRSSIMHTLL